MGRMLDKSAQHLAWTHTLRALLPPNLAPEIEVINYRHPGETLIVFASNSSFATRLRYLLPELITKLSALADFQDLQQIKIRVCQDISPQPATVVARSLSKAANRALTEFAGALQEQSNYESLQAAILRLSEHTAGGADHSTAPKVP